MASSSSGASALLLSARSEASLRSMYQSHEKNASFSFDKLDPLLSNLSPESTLQALSSTNAVPKHEKVAQDLLTNSIAQVSPAERALCIRAAVAAQKLGQWYREVRTWSWPQGKYAHLGKGFIPPSPPVSENASETTYYGSLPANAVEKYERRIEEIRDGIDTLGMEELKEHVLNAHVPYRSRPSSSASTMSAPPPLSYVQLSDFTTVITATILRALPLLSRLNSLLSTWDARLLVLRQIPDLLHGLRYTRGALDSSFRSLQSAESPGEHDTLYSRANFRAKQAELERIVVSVGRKMDVILDALEGREDSLPESWIDDLEAIEADFGNWVVDAERRTVANELVRLTATTKKASQIPSKAPNEPENPATQVHSFSTTRQIGRAPMGTINEEPGYNPEPKSADVPDQPRVAPPQVAAPDAPEPDSNRLLHNPRVVPTQTPLPPPVIPEPHSNGIADEQHDSPAATKTSTSPPVLEFHPSSPPNGTDVAKPSLDSGASTLQRGTTPAVCESDAAQRDTGADIAEPGSAAKELALAENAELGVDASDQPARRTEETAPSNQPGEDEAREPERTPVPHNPVSEIVGTRKTVSSSQSESKREPKVPADRSDSANNEKDEMGALLSSVNVPSVAPPTTASEVECKTESSVPGTRTGDSTVEKSFAGAHPSSASLDTTNALANQNCQFRITVEDVEGDTPPTFASGPNPARSFIDDTSATAKPKPMTNVTSPHGGSALTSELPKTPVSEPESAKKTTTEPRATRIPVSPAVVTVDDSRSSESTGPSLEHNDRPISRDDDQEAFGAHTPAESDIANQAETDAGAPAAVPVRHRLDSPIKLPGLRLERIGLEKGVANPRRRGSSASDDSMSEFPSLISSPEVRENIPASSNGTPVPLESPPRPSAVDPVCNRTPPNPSHTLRAHHLLRLESQKNAAFKHNRAVSLPLERFINERLNFNSESDFEVDDGITPRPASAALFDYERSGNKGLGFDSGSVMPLRPGFSAEEVPGAVSEASYFPSPGSERSRNSIPGSPGYRPQLLNLASYLNNPRINKRLKRNPSLESLGLWRPESPRQPEDTRSRASTFSRASKQPTDYMDEKISSILTNIPARIHLVSQSGHKIHESPIISSLAEKERQRYLAGSPDGSPTRSSTPAPSLFLTSVGSRSRRQSSSYTPEDRSVRVYHLGDQKSNPTKLFVRSVGENSERLMVRVGGGWADLAEYLREYAFHHGHRKPGEAPQTAAERRSPGDHAPRLKPSRPNSALSSRPPSPLFVRKTRRGSNVSAVSDLRATRDGKLNIPSSASNLFARRRDSHSSAASMSGGSRPPLSTSPPASTVSSPQSTPLGLAGPKPRSRHVSMSPESEAWVEDVLGQARRSSATLKPPPILKSRVSSLPQMRGVHDIGPAGVSRRIALRGLNERKN